MNKLTQKDIDCLSVLVDCAETGLYFSKSFAYRKNGNAKWIYPKEKSQKVEKAKKIIKSIIAKQK